MHVLRIGLRPRGCQLVARLGFAPLLPRPLDRAPPLGPGTGLWPSRRGYAVGRGREFLLNRGAESRFRFAPSPTGYPHLGSLRTALYNYLLAKRTGGKLVLRIEDTDRSRVVDDAEAKLYEDLKWAGLQWDEGPDVGGPMGPYRQSERLDIYRRHAQDLLSKGAAYRCFCSRDTLDKQARKDGEEGTDERVHARYPGTCREIAPEEAEKRASGGESHLIRFKGREVKPYRDAVLGMVGEKKSKKGGPKPVEEDFVLIKSDGFPTYHFASVVDDHTMGITHVVRGEEWCVSTPKHVALYTAFGWTPPTFGHVGLLTTEDGEKLSKRSNDTTIQSYREQGIIPTVLVNWLATYGSHVVRNDAARPWHSMPALAANLSYNFSKSPAVPNASLLDFMQRKVYAVLAKADDATALAGLPIGPALSTIRKMDEQKRNSQPVPAPVGDLGNLVPELGSTDEATAQRRMLAVLRQISTTRPVLPGLVTHLARLIWQVNPDIVKAEVARLVKAEPDQQDAPTATASLATFEKLLQTTVKAVQALSADVWGSAQALGVAPLTVEQDMMTDGKVEVDKARFHLMLRLALLGEAAASSPWTAGILHALGRDESLVRLNICLDQVRKVQAET